MALCSDCYHDISAIVQTCDQECEYIEALIAARQIKTNDHTGATVKKVFSNKAANPYELLGVTPTATPDEISSAYRKRAIHLHSDKGGGDESMRKLNNARDILKDPDKKAVLNQKLNLIELLEDGETIDVLLNLAPLSDGYRAQHNALLNRYHKESTTNTYIYPRSFSAASYFSPSKISREFYQRVVGRTVQRPVQRKKQRQVQVKKQRPVYHQKERQVPREILRHRATTESEKAALAFFYGVFFLSGAIYKIYEEESFFSQEKLLSIIFVLLSSWHA